MVLPVDHFQPLNFSDLAGWQEDDQAAAFAAFQLSAQYARDQAYNSGSLGIDFQSLQPIFTAARQAGNLDAGRARQFFETYFLPCRMIGKASGPGLVTGFYEPVIAASRQARAGYQVPFLARPADLVKVTDENRPQNLDPSFAFARQTANGLAEYDDRQQIEQGSLCGQGLEIAYVADRVDAFFAHVQGAARLKIAGEGDIAITYAAKSGHPFTAIGRILVEEGEIAADQISMQAIRAWLARHPDAVDALLWRNRSYIFFREASIIDPALGPVAAAKVQLTAGRSMAVDKMLHTFGTPFFVSAAQLTGFDGRPFSRLMIAQDTGTAIVGPARGDLFAGSGIAAGEIAGRIRHSAEFFALVPRQLLKGYRF